MPTVYFSVRGDSGGTGTKADPYDAAGFGLDTRLRALSQAAVDDVVVFIGPGIIPTQGQLVGAIGWSVRNGWRVIGGWGGGTTTLQQASFSGIGATMIGHPGTVTNVHIRDLTLDLNYDVLKAIAGATPINLQGIWLTSLGGASNNVIRDVIITNACGEDSEAFPCILGSNGTWSTGDVIERVTMTNGLGGTGGGIALYKSSGIVRDCHVEGSYQIAYGGWDLKDAVFEHNTCGLCQYAFNDDSLTNTGIVIRHNDFSATDYGVVLAGHPSQLEFSSCVIEHNRITMGGSGQFAILYQGLCVNNRVTCNTFIGGAASTHAWRITGTGNSGNLYQDNYVPSTWTSSATGGCVYGTMNPDGSPHAGLTNTQGTPCTPGRCPELGINYGHVAAMTAL